MKQNTLQPVSPQYLIDKYKGLRGPDEQRDKECCPLHDGIMNAVCVNAKEHFTTDVFDKAWTGSLFPERVTKQVLRLVEEFTERENQKSDKQRFETRLILHRLIKIFESGELTPPQQRVISEANLILNKYTDVSDVLR